MNPASGLETGFPLEQLAGLNVAISRLVTDSRQVGRGDTFIAYPGERSDGRQYIAEAIARGANAVIWEQHNFCWADGWQVPNLGVAGLRDKAGWLADAVCGKPSEKLWMVGVTGTNGKTSTSHWIARAMSEAGRRCALIGTLGNGFPGSNDYADALQPTANTTPDAVHVHRLLADYLQQGAQAVAMEVSSHALSQGRVNGVRFDVAMLTNLSRDHLDYHGDMQSYAAAKRKLFDWQSLEYVVLNLDDAYGIELAEQLQDKGVEVIAYGLGDAALQFAERLGLRMVYGNLREMTGQGLRMAVHSSWGTAQLDCALVGRFNAANLLGALAVLLASGIALGDAVLALSRVKPVPGRMQRLGSPSQPTVVVDYAHTPDALEKVLQALREVGIGTGGKLICVFGCGGDRDRGKRAMMGVVAERYSDHCIVTSDNPRSEDPRAIIAEIAGGMKGSNHELNLDRAAAIRSAIGRARPGDTVLIAGKGHEDYQEVAGVKQPFSDALVAQQALDASHGGVRA
jgi:UDP-N-acetylmuramoyl-L-alanyl-D-glutamate--2,6-diaminopimelate ligase